MATPQTGAQQTDAVARAGRGDKAPIPKVSRDLTTDDATSKPGRFMIRLNGDTPQSGQADLNAVKAPETLRVAVASIYREEFDAVFITVFNLRSFVS
jgi:hypothetical protein